MRSYEVRGRTGRAVRRKKSRKGEEEEQEEEERGGWAADMTCHRFRERLKVEKTEIVLSKKTKVQDGKNIVTMSAVDRTLR